MEPRHPKTDATAAAIAYLTAVHEQPDGLSPLALELHREAYFADEGATLFVGLQNVAVWLLVKLEKATGQTAAEVLQEMARQNERGFGGDAAPSAGTE